MKRIISLVVVAALGFYVLWPAWSGYVIRNAVQARDPAGLAAKVDFDQVQASLRPVVTGRVEEGFERYQSQLGGAGGLILGQLKKDAVPKIVDASLKTMLTPDMIIRIAAEAGSIKESLDRIMREQIGLDVPQGGGGTEVGGQPPAGGGLGGLLGKVLKSPPAKAPAAEPAPGQPAPGTPKGRSYSLSNVKSFAFNGPLSFRLGVAKDPAAADPDVTVEMSFTGGDWKVTGLVPRT